MSLLAIIGLIAWQLTDRYIEFDLLEYLFSIAVGQALLILYVTIIYLQRKDLHIHHWTLGIMFCCYLGFNDVFVTCLHGFCNGMAIEGGARWGYDPVWKPKNFEDRGEVENIIIKKKIKDKFGYTSKERENLDKLPIWVNWDYMRNHDIFPRKWQEDFNLIVH